MNEYERNLERWLAMEGLYWTGVFPGLVIETKEDDDGNERQEKILL